MRTVTFCLCVLVGLPLWGGTTEFLVNDTADAFRQGTLKDVRVDAEGVLGLSPGATELMRSRDELFWCLAVGSDGIYAGTVEGKVLRVGPQKGQTLAELPGAGVFSLLWHNDALYAGTGPGGTVYRIRPGSPAEKFCVTGEDLVWSLAAGRDGNIIAGTGPEGKLLSISPEGKSSVILDSPASHVLCVATAADGTIYAGTDSKGILYRVRSDGTVQVAYDAQETEIRAMAMDGSGNVFFGTADVQTKRQTGKNSGSGSSEKSADTPRARLPATVGGVGGSVAADNAIYRLDPQGQVIKLVSLEKMMALGLAPGANGMYFGTGNSGRLGLINRDLEVEWVKDELESQVLALVSGPGGELLIATSGEGTVRSLGPKPAAQGEFLSQVFDTEFISRFGVLSWQARTPRGSGLELSTRTGNVAEPDDSWSPFSEPCADPAGSPIQSPSARFIQYRLKLSPGEGGVSPELDAVRIAYLPGNQPPRVASVQVGSKSQKKNAAKSDNTGSSLEVTWKADDPNGDTLRYTVYFRGTDDKLWIELGKDLTDAKLTWDTTTVPDGVYRVRVVASDASDNPGDRALSDERVSPVFTVDNTRPVVKPPALREIDKTTFEATVTGSDAMSRIASASWSLDSGESRPVFPEDLLFDRKTETFRFTLKDLTPGPHVLSVRMTDEAGNTGSSRIGLEVK